ncbi:hypothetical protein F5888DRAFT_1866401 [Russula emetica]|nr:hypothetical protein F5888DRAFT_1866401 [Russula emetica]
MTLWLRAEGLLQVGPFFSSLSLAIQYSMLDFFMLLVNERVIPEPPRAGPILSTLGPIEEVKPPAADVDLLLGSAEEETLHYTARRAVCVAHKMAGLLRRKAEHFSTALAADQVVLRSAEEKIGANYDVMGSPSVNSNLLESFLNIKAWLD